MKQRVKHIILLWVLLAPVMASATIIRVNPDPIALASFTDLQLAHDAANPGDTLFVEGNETYIDIFPILPYSALISKQLIIIGPGYFLNQNNPGIQLTDRAICDIISIDSEGQGTIIKGLTIGQLNIQADNVQVIGNQTGHISCVDLANVELSDNFMQGGTPFVPVLLMDGVHASIVHHNIILHDLNITGGQFSIFENGTSGNVYNHNVIGNANSVVVDAQVINNIFTEHTFDGIDQSLFDNNIFPAGILEVAPFDLMGVSIDPLPIIGNTSNLLLVDLNTVFVGSDSPSPDGEYQLLPGSVALDFATDGDNAGPFTNLDSYVLSGTQSIPIVTSLDVSISDNLLSLLPVTFTAITTDPSSVINQAEYFVDGDPGFGDATPIVVLPSNDVFGFFGLDTQGLPGGIHILGLRVLDDAGQWSQDAFTTFIVEVDPPTPSLATMQFNVSPTDAVDFTNFTEVQNSLGGNIFLFIEFIDLSQYPEGMINLSFRVTDSNGAESTTYTVPILVIGDPLPDPELAYFEYFADNDPGYQNGQIIDIDSAVFLFQGVVTQQMTGLPLGAHDLWIRLRDVEGGFSVTQLREVIVVDELFAQLDLNNDCVVNSQDLLLFLADYGCTDPLMNEICIADFNIDGIVDALDLLQFLSYYGQICNP
jgi:hypothetical protein